MRFDSYVLNMRNRFSIHHMSLHNHYFNASWLTYFEYQTVFGWHMYHTPTWNPSPSFLCRMRSLSPFFLPWKPIVISSNATTRPVFFRVSAVCESFCSLLWWEDLWALTREEGIVDWRRGTHWLCLYLFSAQSLRRRGVTDLKRSGDARSLWQFAFSKGRVE